MEQVSDTDEFRYTTAWFDDQQLLGVMDGASCLPEGDQSKLLIASGTGLKSVCGEEPSNG